MKFLKKILLISTLAASASFAGAGKILIVLSSADHIDIVDAQGTVAQHETGFFLVELMGPLAALKKAGYEIVYANPLGNAPHMDPTSDKDSYFKSHSDYVSAKELLTAEQAQINSPHKLESFHDAELDSFSGIFLPGGHAPMQDLVSDVNLGRILTFFHHHRKPTGLICHAPVALLSAGTKKSWPYKGYTLTAFSNSEEEYNESVNAFGPGEKVTYYIEDKLRKAGANVQVNEPNFHSEAVSFHELVTGRNPQSEEAFTNLFLEALTKEKIKSKKLESWNPDSGEQLQSETWLNVMDENPDWKEGYSTLYIGKRVAALDDATFVTGMEAHIRKAKATFTPMGLKGYIVYIENDHEIAYQNWTSAEAANAAFQTPAAQEVFQQGAAVLDLVYFNPLSEAPTFLNRK